MVIVTGRIRGDYDRKDTWYVCQEGYMVIMTRRTHGDCNRMDKW